MIRSMTAFARVERQTDGGGLVWEIRSVNHRFLETHFRMPEELRAAESRARERIQARLKRGKVDAQLRLRSDAAQVGELHINQAMVDQLLVAAERIAGQVPAAPGPTVMQILQWPGVVQPQEQDLTQLQNQAIELLEQGLDELVATREREGARLRDMLAERVAGMRVQVDQVRLLMPEILDNVRQRLADRLTELAGSLDETRLEQEIALIAQRLDVDEEMDRLVTHLDEVERLLAAKQPVGRRLDFLMQELNREANTLGSKSAAADTSKASVEMKVLIEQMREQVQNVE